MTNEHGRASTADPKTVNREAVAPSATHDASRPWMGSGKRNERIAGAIPFDAKGYTVREVASTTPEGYRPCEDWTIDAEQMTNGATCHYIVDNDFVSSRIQIVKVDGVDGLTVPLAGFSFQLLDHAKNPISQDVWYPQHANRDLHDRRHGNRDVARSAHPRHLLHSRGCRALSLTFRPRRISRS